MTVFAFGNIAIDDLVFADGTTMWGVPGGGAVYAALGAALSAGSAAVIAPIGPEYPRDAFADIDFSRCRLGSHTMRNWGLYETDGSRHFLSRRDSLPWEAFSSDAGELDAGPYAFCHIAPMPWARVVALVEALRTRGARLISLDLHDRELAAVGLESVLALVERVEVFLPSRQDVDVLFPGWPPVAARRALRARLPDVPAIGVKCGPDGAFVHAAGSAQIIVVPSAATEVIDATGAGDAFCGGFLAGFAATGDVSEAALRGAIAASFAVSAVGPSGLTRPVLAQALARTAALRERMTAIPLALP
jgi:sugar/nucleoside kinase (ribokinase family)